MQAHTPPIYAPLTCLPHPTTRLPRGPTHSHVAHMTNPYCLKLSTAPPTTKKTNANLPSVTINAVRRAPSSLNLALPFERALFKESGHLTMRGQLASLASGAGRRQAPIFRPALPLRAIAILTPP